VRNYLLSFSLKQRAFDRNSDVLENPECRVMVDSGAFSVWNAGKRIDVKRYADFAQELMARARCELIFVNLDLIPGRKNVTPSSYERDVSAEQSFRNWEYLQTQGVPTMPVFHQHERFYWLDELKKHSEYIGISPANDVSPRDACVHLCVSLQGSTRLVSHMLGSSRNRSADGRQAQVACEAVNTVLNPRQVSAHGATTSANRVHRHRLCGTIAKIAWR
jgi:hypothetical protein